MPPRPALFLLLQPGDYLSSGGGQICWLRVNAEEGEGEGRSFPRLLLRKSCSSLQSEYSWAAEAATVPPPPVSLQDYTREKAGSPECVCVSVCDAHYLSLSWPQHLQLSVPHPHAETLSSRCHAGWLNPCRCGAASAGVTAAPSGFAEPRRYTWGFPDGDGSTVIVSLLAHCEFIASIAWSTFKFRVHEQHATTSTTTCTDRVGWRLNIHSLRLIMMKGGYEARNVQTERQGIPQTCNNLLHLDNCRWEQVRGQVDVRIQRKIGSYGMMPSK